MNYKKLLITLLVFILAVLPISAQLLPFSLEVRGGLNRSKPSIKHGSLNHAFSYRADAVVDFKMGLGLFTRTGLTLTEKNTKEKYNDVYSHQTAKVKAQYLQIPAMVGYKLGIPMIGSVNVAGGMYFGYGLSGKSKYSYREYNGNGLLIDSDSEKVNTFGNVYKRFDTGLAISAGVEFSRITFNVGYEHGLLNVAKGDANVKNRSVYAAIGFRIL